ncbi:hypothetical protein SA08028_00105 [Staphylococcus aureus]|nr:hypothetical protein SA08028_00105 [Staphylococcus aureus]
MTERKCACNKLFSILVRAPTQRISKRNSTGNASWGGAPTKRNWIPNFYRQCKLGWDGEINFAKISFLSHSPEKVLPLSKKCISTC